MKGKWVSRLEASVLLGVMLLTLVPSIVFAGCGDIVLNELNYADPDVDDEEYVELYSATAAGGGTVSLANLLLRFVNGYNATDYAYQTATLAGNMPSDGYYVVGDPGVTNVDLSTGFSASSSDIQDGSPDALGLYDNASGTWCWKWVYDATADYSNDHYGVFTLLPGDNKDLSTADRSLSRRQVTSTIGNFEQDSGYTPGGSNETPTAITLRTLTAAAPANPWSVALPLLGLVAAGAVAWRRKI